uniref:Uncharacterized protein n=1 Tax=Vespula pensylvanica TaxID=30213 RepID=A0A834K0Q7_VESPE|nr:hypothetical protein H0235_016734 [Vespula pensylvanica]
MEGNQKNRKTYVSHSTDQNTSRILDKIVEETITCYNRLLPRGVPTSLQIPTIIILLAMLLNILFANLQMCRNDSAAKIWERPTPII